MKKSSIRKTLTTIGLLLLLSLGIECGQDFDTDYEKWKAWYEENKDK